MFSARLTLRGAATGAMVGYPAMLWFSDQPILTVDTIFVWIIGATVFWAAKFKK